MAKDWNTEKSATLQATANIDQQQEAKVHKENTVVLNQALMHIGNALDELFLVLFDDEDKHLKTALSALGALQTMYRHELARSQREGATQ